MQADWDDIRIFLAIARGGSLTRAASALQISQPTVGRRLKKLEDAFQARLFDRFPDGFALTPEGTALLPKAEAMEAAAAALTAEADGLSPDAEGTVRLSVDEVVAQILAPLLPKIRNKLPAVELEIGIEHLFASLTRREADILVRDRPPQNTNLIARKLFDLDYAVYGAASYVAANPPARTEERYRECDWIGYDALHRHFAGGEWIQERLGNRAPMIRHNDAAMMGDFIAEGGGLGVLPMILAGRYPDIVRLTDPIPDLKRTVHIYVHQDIRRVAAVRAVIDVLAEETRSLETALLSRQSA